MVKGRVSFQPFGFTQCVAFPDVNPQAPTHILVIPRKAIVKIADTTEDDVETLGRLMYAAKLIAKQENLENGFRLVINNGADAGQTVFHLHLHILAGRAFSWPPG
eukprot:TRINITY_DN778_c0_g1_i1.p1 TRINITY_DN778_c0_g1~~TRINITY_DN778_c0_g1_i1.p1  ORF type:complete len:105 (+),score=25.68 TRINITY_DN778_c0_g1_i1:192-506(+)